MKEAESQRESRLRADLEEHLGWENRSIRQGQKLESPSTEFVSFSRLPTIHYEKHVEVLKHSCHVLCSIVMQARANIGFGWIFELTIVSEATEDCCGRAEA